MNKNRMFNVTLCLFALIYGKLIDLKTKKKSSFVISHFRFECRILVPILPVLCDCFEIPFYSSIYLTLIWPLYQKAQHSKVCNECKKNRYC